MVKKYSLTLTSNSQVVFSADYVEGFNLRQCDTAIAKHEADELVRLEKQDKRIKYWIDNPDMTL